MADDLTAARAEPAAPPEAGGRDYRETVFLPTTPFPMRAGLPKLEPEILKRWADQDLYHAIRARRQAEGAPLFVFHDGPPYANGAIHIGHCLNKSVKDFVTRSRFALGYDVDYVPGWDCHGLPIEWKVEEEFRKQGRSKDQVPAAEFRARCRAYADHWMGVQEQGFKRLGVLGDWAHRYATMDFSSEAAIVGEFHKFLMSGQLYRGSKPVMWSPVERTALADAEVEYHDHNSPQVWVKFPVIRVNGEAVFGESRLERHNAAQSAGVEYHSAEIDRRFDPVGASIVIWTTTPWTIPANRAIAYGPDIRYAMFEVLGLDDSREDVHASVGERLIVAENLADEVFRNAGVQSRKRLRGMFAADLGRLECSHPLATLASGLGFRVPLLPGEHVTEDAGTGFVHTAPGHGQEDYFLWTSFSRLLQRERIDPTIPDTVDPNGAYYDSVPLFGGLQVIESEGKKAGKFGPANGAVIGKLVEAGNLLAQGRLEHSYPHSWRSKAPVLYRNTPQWFIRLDGERHAPPQSPASQPTAPPEGEHPHPESSPAGGGGSAEGRDGGGASLRATALAAIDATAFIPPSGQARLRNMVAGRPDWLVSRQRAWGTPLALFVDRETGEPLRDAGVNARIRDAIAEHGADAWFTRNPTNFLGPERDPADYEKVDDILDVWFDSGCTHVFTLEGRPDSRDPADLYLEGSDQARGWFQSSLLESCGTRGRAPYKAVVTHGFTLTDAGEKMSKSLGNALEPEQMIRESGAEIIRLWAATVDYQEDQRIGKTILQTVTDAYRKLRNTVRYLLGALEGFGDAERVGYDAMPPLERWVLHRLWALDGEVRGAYEAYDFNAVWRALSEFCAGDLSALYFDIRKDALYCDAPGSLRRRACRTVMDAVFERLTLWLSPLCPFTMEEAWTTRFPDAGSNSLRVFPETPEGWCDGKLANRWRYMKHILDAATAALEVQRRDKRIGSALDAAAIVYVSDMGDRQTLHMLSEAYLDTRFRTVEGALESGSDLDAFAAEVFRTSQARILEDKQPPPNAFRLPEAPELAVVVVRAEGAKCERCWRILPEVKSPSHLCLRCVEAVAEWDARHGQEASA